MSVWIPVKKCLFEFNILLRYVALVVYQRFVMPYNDKYAELIYAYINTIMVVSVWPEVVL